MLCILMKWTAARLQFVELECILPCTASGDSQHYSDHETSAVCGRSALPPDSPTWKPSSANQELLLPSMLGRVASWCKWELPPDSPTWMPSCPDRGLSVAPMLGILASCGKCTLPPDSPTSCADLGLLVVPMLGMALASAVSIVLVGTSPKSAKSDPGLFRPATFETSAVCGRSALPPDSPTWKPSPANQELLLPSMLGRVASWCKWELPPDSPTWMPSCPDRGLSVAPMLGILASCGKCTLPPDSPTSCADLGLLVVPMLGMALASAVSIVLVGTSPKSAKCDPGLFRPATFETSAVCGRSSLPPDSWHELPLATSMLANSKVTSSELIK